MFSSKRFIIDLLKTCAIFQGNLLKDAFHEHLALIAQEFKETGVYSVFTEHCHPNAGNLH